MLLHRMLYHRNKSNPLRRREAYGDHDLVDGVYIVGCISYGVLVEDQSLFLARFSFGFYCIY